MGRIFFSKKVSSTPAASSARNPNDPAQTSSQAPMAAVNGARVVKRHSPMLAVVTRSVRTCLNRNIPDDWGYCYYKAGRHVFPPSLKLELTMHRLVFSTALPLAAPLFIALSRPRYGQSPQTKASKAKTPYDQTVGGDRELHEIAQKL